MQVVEFNATVENGVIPIPHQYENTFFENVKVIVRAEVEAYQRPVKQKKKLHYIGIDMTGYKFSREEANGR